jgi:hypothetical protein
MLFDRSVGLGAGLLCAIATTGPAMFATAANTEIFALLPLTLGMLLAARAADRDDLRAGALAGACAGVALLFKWVVAPMLVVQLAVQLFWRPLEAAQRGRHLLVAIAGGALVLALTLIYFAAVGGLGAMVDATLIYNFTYATSIPLSRYPEMLFLQLDQSQSMLMPLGLAALLSPLARGLGTRAPCKAAGGVAWLWAWLGASLLAVSAGGYFRPHYFLLALPPLCLLAALGVADLVDALGASARRRLAAVVALAALLLAQAVWAAPWYYRAGHAMRKARLIYDWNPFPESVAIGRFIAERSEPTDRVFVFGSEPQIYYYAKRQSATRYIYTYPLAAPAEAALVRQRGVLDALESSPPRFIVGIFVPRSLGERDDTPTLLREGLQALVQERYLPVATVPQHGDGESEVRTRRAPLRSLADGAPFAEREPKPRLIIWERR